MPLVSPNFPRWCVVGVEDGENYAAVFIAHDGSPSKKHLFPTQSLARFVAEHEAAHPVRWVWHDSAAIYARILTDGVRVERCHDLRLCHRILRSSAFVRDHDALLSVPEWNVDPAPPNEAPSADALTLFDVEPGPSRFLRTAPAAIDDALAEFDRQRTALASSPMPGRLALLLAAESAGALIAAELAAAGVPWDVDEHDRILTAELGPRPALGAKPERMIRVGEIVRQELGDPTANIDSPPQLLRALRAAGIEVSSTSKWDLAEHEHPAVAPLLAYKKLSRLLTANGWHWLDEWVHEGRYRPVYLPGGVVTGRWASSGGGALQIPRQLRPALRADEGWLLVSADVSQLEPRVLAAMSGDGAMAAAGAGKDLYAGIVESGAVATRQDAKIAVLGAMYGSTTGDSGRLVPRLRRTFPAAMRLVDDAARTGEQGGVVSTWLGRTSPPPSDGWRAIQSAASMPGASRRDEELARRTAREWGRFTRNFVVQGTAAEWAVAWMANLRQRLTAFDPVSNAAPAQGSGPVFARRPHLAFFLHDEVIVHTPAQHADAVAEAVVAAAHEAGRQLFGSAPVDFRLDLRISERAAKD